MDEMQPQFNQEVLAEMMSERQKELERKKIILGYFVANPNAVVGDSSPIISELMSKIKRLENFINFCSLNIVTEPTPEEVIGTEAEDELEEGADYEL